MSEGFFPNANKITKFQESANYWIFKTGEKVYKVKKDAEVSSAVPLEEIFCAETCRQLSNHSPDLKADLFTIKQVSDSFAIDLDGTVGGKPLFYGISMRQLPDRGFLSNIVEKNKLSDNHLKRIAKRLSDYHSEAKVAPGKDDGSPDSLSIKLQDLFYQSKKYLNVTINQAMIDMTLRPLEKSLVDNRKLLLKRMKSENIRQVHGCFMPRKINITSDAINFLGRTSDPLKSQYSDTIADVADLSVMLGHLNQVDKAKVFVDAYFDVSGDKESQQLLPIYQALKSLELGLVDSVKSHQADSKLAASFKDTAVKYYEQTVEIVRSL